MRRLYVTDIQPIKRWWHNHILGFQHCQFLSSDEDPGLHQKNIFLIEGASASGS